MNSEKTEALTKVNCTVFDEDFSDNKSPFFLEISISGHFELGDTNGEMTMETFELNAVTILFTVPSQLYYKFYSPSWNLSGDFTTS
ncbi:hypothetical protein ACT7DN_00060 [Bacillus paranthracis]